MFLCSLIYNDKKLIIFVEDLVEIMNIGNKLYFSLLIIFRNFFLMLIELFLMIMVYDINYYF